MELFTQVNSAVFYHPKVDYSQYINMFIDSGYENAEFDWEHELGRYSIYHYNFQTIVQGLRTAIKCLKAPVRIVTRKYHIYFTKEG